jgi:hypothetical protein
MERRRGLFLTGEGERMGEVKSTLELALERTKKLTLSAPEKEELKKKEILKKATGLYHRYMEGHVSLNDLLKEMERTEAETAAVVKEKLLSLWLEELSLLDDNGKRLKGIESLKGERTSEIVREHQQLVKLFQEECRKAKEGVAARLTEELKRMKIHGSAVDPCVEKSPLWQEKLKEIEVPYRNRLGEIKDRLSAL